MKGTDDGSRESGEKARTRAGGWNELYSVAPKGIVVDPTELVDVLRRFVRQIVDEALVARGIR